MSTSGLVSASGAPLGSSTTDAGEQAGSVPPRGLSAVRATHMVALATAQSAMATAANVAAQRGKHVEATQAKDVSLTLTQLAICIRDALVDHVDTIKQRDRHDFSVIPAALIEGLDEYAATGRETGDFLRAVLEDSLSGAVMHADERSVRVLPQLVGYLYNAEHIPAACHGSPLKVAEWVARKSAERLASMRALDELKSEGSRELPADPADDTPAQMLARDLADPDSITSLARRLIEREATAGALPDPSDAPVKT